ncbi:MAG TPA: N-acetylmuramoyl-L-alanine amidase [Trueperaceae bacterium]
MQDLAPRRAATRRAWLTFLLLLSSTVLLALTFPQRTDVLTESTSQAATSTFRMLRNRLLGPPKVGIQIGHLDAQLHPEELASLRASTGGYGGGQYEVEVNEAVARALAARLRERGLIVELLPATIPPNYRADLVVSLHADSSPAAHRRGYKSAVFRPRRNRWDARLKALIDDANLGGSTLPDDDRNVTGDMLEYYAFNPAYRHSLARRTPAVIVEMGYLSHPLDMRLLQRPERVAGLLEEGIVDFLEQRGRL